MGVARQRRPERHNPVVEMSDLKRVPGCHVYWGPSPLAPGIAKLPKEKVIIFNVDGEAEADLKDVPAVKTPFDKERPVTLGMIAACSVKAAKTVNKMRDLVAEGITEKDWTEALIKKTFEEPNPDKE